MKKAFILTTALLASLICFGASPLKPGEFPSDDGLFPFMISYKMADGVTDFSYLLDAPAGKNGFTRIEGNHFANDKGPIRFNGFNIVGGACFPPHELAERTAERLAHFGINLVRLHFFDLVTYGFSDDIREKGLLVDDATWCNFDPYQLDKFEYLIYQLKQKGIYVDVNLLVGRPFKELNATDPKIQQMELDFSRKLFTHVNPYTGLSLAQDPCMALVEVNNENAFFTNYGRAAEYGYPSREELKGMSEDQRKQNFDRVEAADRNHWDRQKDLLVNELGVKIPITSSQVSYSSPWAFDGMDYLDMHAYWQHPSASANPDNWAINNIPMVNDPSCGNLSHLANYRPVDRPYTVSEYNNPYPNFYGAEGQPMMHAFAAYQGWDGFIAHSYNNQPLEPSRLPYHFTYCCRTDALAHFLSCASMFLRRDVKESDSETTVIDLPRDVIRDGYGKTLYYHVDNYIKEATDSNFWGAQHFLHKSAINYKATSTKTYPAETVPSVLMSDTKELEWNNSIKDQGMFIVRTKNTKMFTGFPAGRAIDFGDGIKVNIGQTKLGWATISLVSHNGNGFAKGANAVLVATGFTKQTGQIFASVQDADGNATTHIHSHRVNYGRAPMLNEGIPAKITLPSSAKNTRCWALDESGVRKCEVPVTSEGGKAVIEIGAKYKTIWYEIETK
ncbi:MAG: hypothetical protein KBS57_01465 [Alistipes sp.]|nr:hypothetical protein [Candidatus Minthomonas equi]